MGLKIVWLFLISVLFQFDKFSGVMAIDKGCGLEIIIDPFFHAYFTELQTSQRSTLEIKRRLGLMAQDYVDFTNDILQKYSFFKDGSFVKLFIKRIKIFDHNDVCSKVDEPYCTRSSNLHNLLSAHSQQNHNDVCLSYIFTYQQLSDSTLGLAWTANVNKANEGGVCAKFHELFIDAEDPNLSQWESRNTGIVNFAYHLKALPTTVSKLAFAHEIGHSFGSPHDYPKKCLGDDVQGNFLMHESGVRGYLQNNDQLSPCSYHNITAFFNNLIRQDRNCLVPAPNNVCGNGIVESWEECDCGETKRDCQDKCCYAADHRDLPCQLKERKTCSPSEGPCCTEKCEFAEAGSAECSEGTECRFATNCTGKSTSCPIALHKSDSSTCESGSKICKDGSCVSSICGKFNQVECTLKDASPCQIHCQVPKRPETCKSSTELESLFTEPVYRPFGAPCDMLIEEKFALGSCSARHECIGGPPTLKSSSWAVGLGIFLICYTIFMFFAIWMYCKYCRNRKTEVASGEDGGKKPELVLKPESVIDD